MKTLKKILKAVVIFLIIIVVVVGGWWIYIKYIANNPKTEALKIIPEDAVFVVVTKDISKAWTEISNSNVWNFLIKNPYFKDMDGDIKDLNTYLKNSKVASFILTDRDLLMSAHMISKKDWDFLFVVDLKEVAGTLKGGLKGALGFVDGYQVTERKYKDQYIVELAANNNPKDKIYLSIVNNLLLATFTGSLIEKTIDEKDKPKLDDYKQFREVTSNLGRRKLFRFFFNYKQLNKFSRAFLSEESSVAKMLSNSLTFSAFDIGLNGDILQFKGYSGVDSVGSYIKALASVAPGKMQAWKITSDQASLYMSIGFKSFNEFYNNLIEQYKEGNAKDMENIEKTVGRIEGYLGISLKEHFFDWIGNEIAFVKLRPGKDTRLEDVIAIFHTNNIENAKTGMAYILRKIKNRTPLVFKTYNYKNYDIFRLERHLFFKLFFTKTFKNMEKPYFTFIEDFVVFSNSEVALKKVIRDYITSNTLKYNTQFTNFKDGFRAKSNVSIFIRMPKMYQNLYQNANIEDKKSIRENSDFILSFARIGFQLVSDNKAYETTLLAEHDPQAVNADKLEITEKETTESSFRESVDSLKFKVSPPIEVFEKDTNYIEYFADGKTIKYEGKVRNGKFDGLWKSYYQSGRIKNSITYVDGKINKDAAFYFDDKDNTVKAEVTFEDDKVTGYYQEFYPNGARKSKIWYSDGVAHGPAEYYHRNGKLKITGRYKNGKKHRRWKFYDEKEKLIGKQKWRNGVKKWEK